MFVTGQVVSVVYVVSVSVLSICEADTTLGDWEEPVLIAEVELLESS